MQARLVKFSLPILIALLMFTSQQMTAGTTQQLPDMDDAAGDIQETPDISDSAVNSQNLPDIGDSAGSLITPEFERRLGQAIMRQIRRSSNVISDPEIESYIQSIGYRLVANSDDNRIPFTFFVLNNPQINAFAAPGGVVGVNSGVILNSGEENELAGVMAHEISHVTQRHLARTYEVSSRFSLPSAAALIGAILLGIANPEAGQAAIAAVAGLSAQMQINFTRAHEEEADRVGMQLLARSGFDPFGMPKFFQRLQQATKFYGRPPEFLLTHPLTSNRIADSISRAEQYPAREHLDTITYKQVRAKLMANSYDKPGDAIGFFEKKLQEGGYPDMDAARYGYAIALTNAHNFPKAREQLRLLLENNGENVSYLLAAARLELAQQNYPAALAIYRQTERLYPNYRPVVIGYSRALLDAGQPEQARTLLRKYSRNNIDDLVYHDLLSQAEAQSGSPAEAGIAKAEYYYLAGGTQLAIDRLKFAQQQPDLTYYQEERIKARLAQLENELELEKEIQF